MSKLTDDILHSVDIVDVISRYVPLKRAGSNFSGCCPFHNEKTPSFMVSPHKQIFKCFGCGKWWNVFTFLQEYERIDFWDSVKILAKEANIDIKKYDVNSRKLDQYSDQKEKIKRIHKLAQKFFVEALQESPQAMQYLQENRKLKPDIIKEFGIGYAPDSAYQLWKFLKSKGFSDEDLLQTSLIKPSKNSDFYTFFRKRITFPIYDTMNNVVGFSARVLDPNDNPKYLNSSEHPAFEKSKILYWLNFAKQHISQFGYLIVVEWQMDVIALHRLGFPVAVATSGTAISEDHIKLIKRYTDTVYFLFDEDAAGQSAMQRALSISYKHDLFPKQLSLGENFKDVDELANHQSGNEIFKKVLEEGKDWFMWVFQQLKTQYDINSAIDKQKILNNLFDLILNIKSFSLQQHYIQEISDETNSLFEFTYKQFVSYKKSQTRFQRKNTPTKSDIYQPSREALFASLFHWDFIWQYQETPALRASLLALKEFLIKIDWNPISKYLEEQENKESIDHHQLRREKEFELKSEDKKIQLIKETIGKTIQDFRQQMLKNPNLSHWEKAELLKLSQDFSN